ncbi:MAG: hypothetical protein ACK56I_34700, partial [bacterium]
MEDDHVVARHLAQRLFDLAHHLLHRCFVGPPAAGGADDNFIAPVGHGGALLDRVAAADEEVPPCGGLLFSVNHPVMDSG